MVFSNRTVDTLLRLEDGAAAMSDGALQSDIVDLGGDTVLGTATTARMFCAAEFNITSMDFTTGDESYDLYIVGSNTAAVTSGVAILASLTLGDTDTAGSQTTSSAITGIAAVNPTLPCRYVVPFINEKGGTVYRYIALWLQQVGTTPSIIGTVYLYKVSEAP